jgi:hypothetical protein
MSRCKNMYYIYNCEEAYIQRNICIMCDSNQKTILEYECVYLERRYDFLRSCWNFEIGMACE